MTKWKNLSILFLIYQQKFTLGALKNSRNAIFIEFVYSKFDMLLDNFICNTMIIFHTNNIPDIKYAFISFMYILVVKSVIDITNIEQSI